MHIRNIQTSDHADVIGLWTEVFGQHGNYNQPSTMLNDKLQHQAELLFVATENSRIIGTIMAGYDGHRGWLYSLAVAADFRQQGVGRQLVEHAEQALRATGCRKLNLQVRADNAAVVSFYEKLGFHSEPRISMGKVL